MKILVVDDHPLILAALGQLLPRGERPLSVIGAADRDEAYAMLAAHPECALVLLDLALPGTRGLELLGAMRRDFPRLPIAVLSARTTAPPSTPRWLPVRAATSPRRQADAISCTRSNGCWTAAPAPVRTLPARPFRRRPAAHPRPTRSDSRAAKPTCSRSSHRASQQVDLPRPEALRSTVKVHVSAILRALNVHTRAQAIAELARRGLGTSLCARS